MFPSRFRGGLEFEVRSLSFSLESRLQAAFRRSGHPLWLGGPNSIIVRALRICPAKAGTPNLIPPSS